MYCGKCGVSNAEESVYCRSCGNRLGSDIPPVSMPVPPVVQERTISGASQTEASSTAEPAPAKPVVRKSRLRRIGEIALAGFVVLGILIAETIYESHTRWKFHREGNKVYVEGNAEYKVKMIDGKMEAPMLSVGCENGVNFVRLAPIPLMPIGETDDKPIGIAMDEVFYAKRSDYDGPGAHIVNYKSAVWRTIAPSITNVQRAEDMVASEDNAGLPMSAPDFARKLSESELFVVSASPFGANFGTKDFKDKLPQLMQGCDWK